MIYPDRLPTDPRAEMECRACNGTGIQPDDRPSGPMHGDAICLKCYGKGTVLLDPAPLPAVDPRTNLKLKPDYSAKLESLMSAYRARSKAHLLEMLIDDALAARSN